MLAEISSSLIDLAIQDQTARQKYLDLNDPTQWDDVIAPVDAHNISRLHQIIEEIGWPTITKVGREASFAAWLIVQHADHDFQKQVLALMDLSLGDIDPKNYAYLLDRVLTIENSPQKYGTQFWVDPETGEKQICPLLFSVAETDVLRSEIGLPSLADYLST